MSETQTTQNPTAPIDKSVEVWFNEHRFDYRNLKSRMQVARNVLLHGREDAAAHLLRLGCVYGVLTPKAEGKEQRAFTAYVAGDCSIETAASMVPYSGSKAQYIHHNQSNVDYREAVTVVRESDESPWAAVEYVAENVAGLSYKMAGHVLAMCGLWEVCDTSSRVMDQIHQSSSVRTREEYQSAVEAVDDRVRVSAPTAIKAFAAMDEAEGEYDPRAAFYREVVPTQ